MGRLMDAVRAVSALAMALAVDWADWLMRCCGVGSVAMYQISGPCLSPVLDGPIRKTGRRTQKHQYLRNHQSDWSQICTAPSWGCLLTVGGATTLSSAS